MHLPRTHRTSIRLRLTRTFPVRVRASPPVQGTAAASMFGGGQVGQQRLGGRQRGHTGVRGPADQDHRAPTPRRPPPPAAPPTKCQRSCLFRCKSDYNFFYSFVRLGLKTVNKLLVTLLVFTRPAPKIKLLDILIVRLHATLKICKKRYFDATFLIPCEQIFWYYVQNSTVIILR